jgi:hypothetical protein
VLFRRLFRGRTDVYPVRWQSKTTGKSGYARACANEWRAGVCEKPRIKCGDCANRLLVPLADAVIYKHLAGDHTVGVYPLLEDDSCYFLAVDFDEAEWRDDARAFMQSCGELGVPAALQISRSGQGAHAWVFFAGRVSARDARRLGTAIISHTCARTRQLRLTSYDRLFPNQDTMPKGGFGNLIALPLQKGPREQGFSVFVDAELRPYPDQWAFLASIQPMIARRGVNTLVLVHRTELLEQWQERLQAFLGVGKGVVGTIGGGKAKPSGRIDIAVMQSLSRQGEVNPLVEDYGHVIVDECHHVGAVSFDAILKRTKAKYVLGLTATPIRRDGQQPIIFMQCGPIRHTAATPAGAPHDLEVVPRSRHARIDLPPDAGIQDVFRYLANDQARTEVVAAEVRDAVVQGRKVLALTERTEHLDAIEAALGGVELPPFVLHGRMSGYAGTRHAGVLEGHAAAVCRASAPGTRQQDRRADHRLRRHRPPGAVADVGQAPAWLPGDGVSDRGRGFIL